MASVHNQVINDIKYQNVRVNNAGTWQSPKEVHINHAGTWKEPKSIWVNKAGVWTKTTTLVKYIQGSTTFFAQSPAANQFNNYVDSGASYAVYEFEIVLTTTGVQQTLFSYGNSTSTSYYEIYINTSNQVVSSSRFNSSSIYTYTHATGLSANTYYKITVQHKTATGTRTIIQIRSITGATIGTDIGNTGTTAGYSTSAVSKFIGKRWTHTNYFRGIILRVYLYGAQTTSSIKDTFDSGVYLSGSTPGSTTLTDTSGTAQNFTITGSSISSTE